MKKKIFIGLGVIMSIIASCSQELPEPISVAGQEEEIPVKIAFSFNEALKTGSELIPMGGGTRTGGTVKAIISNVIKIAIAKEVNGQWILEKYFDHEIKSNQQTGNGSTHDIVDGMTFDPIHLQLTPGNYKMAIFTGSRSLRWNSILKPGMVVGDSKNPDATTPWACSYMVNTQHLNKNWPALNEEIFSGLKDFTVAKTTDLHTETPLITKQIELKRRVGKLRFVLKQRTEANPGTSVDRTVAGREKWQENPDQDFYYEYQCGITAKLRIVNPSQQFVSGLNIWGEPQYEYYAEETFKKTLTFGTYTWMGFSKGNDGNHYMMGMIRHTNQSSFYFFTEKGVELPLEVYDVQVSSYVGGPIYVYDGSFEGLSLKHNEITGAVFAAGNTSWVVKKYDGSAVSEEEYKELLLVTDGAGKPARSERLFDYFYENNKN